MFITSKIFYPHINNVYFMLSLKLNTLLNSVFNFRKSLLAPLLMISATSRFVLEPFQRYGYSKKCAQNVFAIFFPCIF